MPRNNARTDTREEYHGRGLKDFNRQEQAVPRRSEELKELLMPFFEEVVPRLLRALESIEKKIKPCLLHGDIWYGNAVGRIGTDKPANFDPAKLWAHNEHASQLFPQLLLCSTISHAKCANR